MGVVDSWDFGSSTPWVQVGGTSLATPLWAGIVALADQGVMAATGSTLDAGRMQTLAKLYSIFEQVRFMILRRAAMVLIPPAAGYDDW